MIATGVIGMMLLAMTTSGRIGWTGGEYQIKILLDSAPGVGVNTPVQKNGVHIGRVESVDFPDDSTVQLTVSIQRKTKILSTDICRVQPSSIFGDAVVTFTSPPSEKVNTPIPAATNSTQQQTAAASTQLVALGQVPPRANPPTQQEPADQVIQPGQTIRGEVVPSPVDLLIEIQADVGPAITSLSRAGDEVARLADRVNQALGDNIEGRRIPELLDKTSVAMDNFSRTMENIDKIVGDEQNRDQIKATLDNASKLVEEARTTLNEVQQTMNSFDRAVTSLDQNLKNIEGLTEPLGQRGAELADLLISSIENFDIVMSDMRKFTYNLNNSNGTIGKLLNDPLLYNNINQTVCNANKVIEGLNYSLWPIMENVKIFTDKVAREPGRILGGSLNPSFIK